MVRRFDPRYGSYEFEDDPTGIFCRYADVEAELAARRWVPVTERLPEGGQHCAVFTEDRAIECAFLDGGRWYDYRHDELDLPVTHWMPLPEPPT